MSLQSLAFLLASAMTVSSCLAAITMTLFLFSLPIDFFFGGGDSLLQTLPDDKMLQGFLLINHLMSNTVGKREAICPMSHLNWFSWAHIGSVSIPELGIVARGTRSTEWSDSGVV